MPVDEDIETECGSWPSEILPVGWRWQAFEQTFENVTSPLKLSEKEYASSGRYSVVDQGAAHIGGYTDNKKLLHPGPLPALVFGDHTRRVKYVDHEFVQGADGVKVLVPRSDLDARYAFWALSTVRLPDKGYSRHFKFLTATKFPCAPLNEQRRIVAKIEALTQRSRRAKEALDAIPPLLERFRQSVLASAFRGDLTKDWRAKHPDVEPAEELLKRIRQERRKRWEEAELAKLKANGKTPKDDRWKEKYEEPAPVDAEGLPELPEGWCWVAAEEVAWDVTVGHVGPMQDEYCATGIPFLRSQNVRENRFDARELRFVSPTFHAKLSKSALRPGDLVVVRSGAPGTACVIPGDVGDANCSDLVIVRLMRGIDPHVTAYYLNSAEARDGVRAEQVGVAQQHFNVGSMRRKPLPLAPVAEQAVLRATLDSAWTRIGSINTMTRAAQNCADGLDASILAKAFRGELTNGTSRE